MARAVAPSSNMRSNGRAVSRLNELQAPATDLWQHMPRRPWDDFCPGRCLSSRVQPFPQAPSREVTLTPPSKICSTASLAAPRPDRSSRSRRLASVGDCAWLSRRRRQYTPAPPPDPGGAPRSTGGCNETRDRRDHCRARAGLALLRPLEAAAAGQQPWTGAKELQEGAQLA